MVESVSPTEGAVGTELTINGTNFRSGPEVLIDGIAATDVEYSSPTLIYVSVPSGVAANSLLTVTVQNSDDQSASLEGAFTAIDPQLSFVNSATKPSGNIGSTVIIEGRAFGDKQGGSFTATGWTVNEESLQKSRSKHTTVIAGGNIFVSCGLYAAAGQGSSENVYAQLNSDGSVGSFAGATGSNTLQSEGGANLFNQAGLSYVDDEGVSHVMIIGGDEVNDPGTRKSNVLFY